MSKRIHPMDMKREQRTTEMFYGFKVGDPVFPAYDGKCMRTSRCIIRNISNGVIEVKGLFWGHDEEEVGYFSLQRDEDNGTLDISGYVGDKDALMSLIGISEEGDYYSLYSKEYMEEIKEMCLSCGSFDHFLSLDLGI